MSEPAGRREAHKQSTRTADAAELWVPVTQIRVVSDRGGR